MTIEYNARNINIARAGSAIAGVAIGAGIGAGFGALIGTVVGGPIGAPIFAAVGAGVGAFIGGLCAVHSFNNFLNNEDDELFDRHSGPGGWLKIMCNQIATPALGATTSYGASAFICGPSSILGTSLTPVGFMVVGGATICAATSVVGGLIAAGFSFFSNKELMDKKLAQDERKGSWFNFSFI